MKIKIMHYNIFVGFHDIERDNKGGASFLLNKKRLKAAQRVVKKQNPDILLMTEANFGALNPRGLLVEYKKEFKVFNHGWYTSPRNFAGMIILSKYEISDVNLFRFKGSMGFKAKIRIKNKDLRIDCIHPEWDGTEKEKIYFAKIILHDIIAPYLLTGDFNSLSDEDKYDKESMFKVFRRIGGKEGVRAAKILLKPRFIPYLKKRGLIDASKKDERRFTIPTDLVDKEKLSPLRLDYFFTTKDTRVIRTRVITGPDVEKASDHYPIIAEIEI